MSNNRDVFLEYMVPRKPPVWSRAIRILVWPVVLLLVFVLLILGGLLQTEAPAEGAEGEEGGSPIAAIVTMLTPLAAAGALFGGWQLFIRQTMEFEYIVTNGEVDVDRIVARRYRKRLLSVNCRDFETLAPAVQRFHHEMDSQSIVRRIEAASSPQSDKRWFAVFNDKKGLRTILFFEPNQRMLDAFRQLIPRKMQQP
ncbi:MAG: DUF6106 family protein [Oscillospiraceae bacterium]|jgi:hypothetical protein|nr:DUF6106 family protein [Oscillospiraceae bacterium]